MQDLQPIGENEHIEWDGLRRRRTTIGTNPSIRSRGNSTPFPPYESVVQPATPHPPLGMSHFPDPEDESDHDEERPTTSVSLFTRAKSILIPPHNRQSSAGSHDTQSPMHPVPLNEIAVPPYRSQTDGIYEHDAYGLPLRDQKTEYQGVGSRHITIPDDPVLNRPTSSGSSLLQPGPTPPPHSARRQFSFQNIIHPRGHRPQDDNQAQPRSPKIRLGQRKLSHGAQVKGATEEERLGLVKGDTNIGRTPQEPEYSEDYEEEPEDWTAEDKYAHRQSPDRGPQRDLTPPRRDGKEKQVESSGEDDNEYEYEKQHRSWVSSGKHPQGKPPPPPPSDEKPGQGGAFV